MQVESEAAAKRRSAVKREARARLIAELLCPRSQTITFGREDFNRLSPSLAAKTIQCIRHKKCPCTRCSHLLTGEKKMRGPFFFSWFLLVATQASTVATLAASPIVPANYEFSLATSNWGFQFSCASASETIQCTPGPQAVQLLSNSDRDLVVQFSVLSRARQLSYHAGRQPRRTSLNEHDLRFDIQYACLVLAI